MGIRRLVRCFECVTDNNVLGFSRIGDDRGNNDATVITHSREEPVLPLSLYLHIFDLKPETFDYEEKRRLLHSERHATDLPPAQADDGS